MSLVRDIIDRVLFPNREIHVIPVLDGAFSPNQRLDEARELGSEIARPDDLALGRDGALYVSSGDTIWRCAGSDYAEREAFARLPASVGDSPGRPTAACLLASPAAASARCRAAARRSDGWKRRRERL